MSTYFACFHFPLVLFITMNFYSNLRSNLRSLPWKPFPASNSRSNCLVMEPIKLYCVLSKVISQFACTLLSVSAVCRLIPTKLKHRRSRRDKNQLHKAFGRLSWSQKPFCFLSYWVFHDYIIEIISLVSFLLQS